MAAHLRGPAEWPAKTRPLLTRPLAWVAPNLVSSAHRPPRGRFLLRSHGILSRPRIKVRQDGRELWRGRLRRLVPGRSAHIPADWTAGVDPEGGPVTVEVA